MGGNKADAKTNLIQALQKVLVNQQGNIVSTQGVSDFLSFYRNVLKHNQSQVAIRQIREDFEVIGLTPHGTSSQDIATAMRSVANVRKLRDDVDAYITTALAQNDPSATDSVIYAQIIKAYLDDELSIAQAVNNPTIIPSRRSRIESSLRSDFASLRAAQLWLADLANSGSLAQAMTKVADVVKGWNSPFHEKIVKHLQERLAQNDIEVIVFDPQQNPELDGYYDVASGKLYIANNNFDMNKVASLLMHETMHVYFARGSIHYKLALDNLLAQGLNRNDITAKMVAEKANISESEASFYMEAEAIISILRSKEITDAERKRFGDALNEQDLMPYGVAQLETDATAIAEFAAELYSNKAFKQWAEERLAAEQQVSKKTAKGWLRRMWEKLLNAFGITKVEPHDLTAFAEKGIQFWTDKAWVDTNFNGKLNVLAADVLQRDMDNGVRYYTFKRKTVTGHSELSGSARYNENTGMWDMQFRDEHGNIHDRNNLDISDVMNEANAQNLHVYGRSMLSGTAHVTADQISSLKMTHPRLAALFENIHQFLMNYLSEESANNVVGHMYHWALNFEVYAMNRDALHTWIERALVAKNGSAANAQQIINDINAKFFTELNESGLNGATLKDHKAKIMEVAKQYNVNVKELNDMVYALTAKHRKELFDKNPGEINPYTGKPYRDGMQVSGFQFTRNGVTIKDDNGAIFLSTLSPQKQQFIGELEKLWIEQNNRALDLEYQSGAISKSQYEALYGKFYAPLRNEMDTASAFYKRALGRYSVAKDPATNYYTFLQARMNYARHQAKNKELLKLALNENVQSVVEVNQVKFVQKGDELSKKWVAPNAQDAAVIRVWDGDTQYTMQIVDENIAKIVRKMDAKQTNFFWDTLATTTRALSMVRTSLSPTFVPAAFGRDILTAMGNIQGAFSNMHGALNNDEAQALAPRVAARAMSAAVSILKGKATNTRSWEYDVFKRAGGGITMNAQFDFEKANDWLKKELTTDSQGNTVQIGQGLRKVKGAILKAAEISHGFEDAVRFAAFMEFLELRNGGNKFNSEQELVQFLMANPELKSSAVNGSKNITGNFEVKGANVGWRSAYMFFNASMVGITTAARMLDPKHGMHGLKFAALLSGLMLASLAMVDGELGDDEDGKSKAHRVNKLGDSLCFGGACIQVPHEFRGFTNLLTAGYFTAKGDYSVGDAVARTMHGILQMGSPWQFDGMSTSGNKMHTLMQNVMPTLAELPLQWATGYNSFGQEYVPEYAYDANGSRIMNAMDWQKSKMSDPTWTKWLAMNGQKWLGLDVSSSTYDHTAQFLLGSVYTSIKRFGNGVQEGKPWSEILYDTVGRGFGMEYDNRALITEKRNALREARASLQMGDSTDQINRSLTDLRANPKYAKLVALEKAVEKAEKNLRFNGKSYAELYRQKQQGVISGNLDLIFEANEGLDVLGEQRRELWSDFDERLEAIMNGDYF